ncbi:aminopeptidase [Pontibacillus yanchengensis]|uniref:Aminopeptidase n=2 Tax=Pontibacillus yanchengensis TaxID=462910 RepID=A0ACC7VJJ9_9BACI|nr:aminopeptidase [Pontibacillus yanchengensis]MYL34831.1 aminopeptidase [Pontibacillus yanchengensis]MYL54795.1 aminopeptidase [Pontibacillus yanchengensis]
MPNKQQLEKYADLALKKGVNLQENQTLMMNAPIEGADLARIVARKAYEMGAKNVHINWSDDTLQRLWFDNAAQEVIESVPEWKVDMFDAFAEEGAAVLSIRSTNPDLLNGVDSSRIAAANKASGEAMKNFRQYTMNDKITWSIVAIPNTEWAQKVFPDVSEQEAVDKLWEQIFTITRVDQEDPIKAWNEHNEILGKARDFLNKKQFKTLIYKAPGTELEVELPEGHIWKGGASTSEQGTTFNANMPTEEVFTLPHKYGVNGTVASTKPLSYGGNLIDNFTLTFEEGKVVDFSAEQGYETLKNLLDMDEGARRLGELALVPHHSPISQSGIIFYNTLYDENASCHLALGKAYPSSIKGGADMNDEKLDENGVNNSIVHVDFMVGSGELNIDGITADGSTEPVFRNGNWAIDFE